MATKYYLQTATAPYTPATLRGAWDQTAGAITKALSRSTAHGGTGTTIAIAETNVSTTFDVLLARFVSGPLAAQTLSGTVDLLIGVGESAASADMNWHVHMYVTQGDSDTPRGTILTDYVEGLGVNEWGTTDAFKGLTAPQTLSSLAIQAGDRIVVELGYISREASATSRTGTLWYGTQFAGIPMSADGVLAGSNVNSRLGYITFSMDIAESATIPIRLSQVAVEVLSSNIPTVADPGGGGTVPSGTDPSAGVSLCGQDTAVVWITVQTDSGEKTYAKTDFGLDTTFREGRLKSIGAIERALSDTEGRIETATTTIALIDADRVLRGLADAGTLLNKRVDVYVASLAQIAAASTPRRAASLIIRDFEPTGDLGFTLQCEDYFGSFVGELLANNQIPQRTFGTFDGANDFPNLPIDLVGKAIPILYGLLSDEADDNTGVTPCIFVGARRLSDGLDWDEYVICGHAIKTIQSWYASDLAESPARTKMGPATEGTEFLIPGHTGWTAIFGATPYVTYNSNRYTVIFARGDRSDAAKAGSGTPIPLAVNCGGIEDVGDGSGTMIDGLALQIQHFIANFVLVNYRDGSWPSIPSVNGYSRLNTASFAAAQAISALRIGGSGYLGAWYLGEDGGQQTAVEAIGQLAKDADLNLGTNRHGQIVASMPYSLTASVMSFVDTGASGEPIAKGSFWAKRRMELLANASLFRYKRRLMSLVATNGPLGSYASDWLVEGQWYADAGSIAAHGEKRTRDQSLLSVRDDTTAQDVPAQIQARRYYAPIYAGFVTNLCGLDVDLGDNITVTHFAGMTGSGWSAKLLRVERLTFNPDEMTVEIEGQAIA